MAEEAKPPARPEWRPGRGLLAAVLALALALAACAELRTRPTPPPAGLAQGAAEPSRAVIRAAAADFADRGAGLADRPGPAALAAARLEWLAQQSAGNGPLATLGGGVPQELALARTELRDALGVAEAASPTPTIAALLATARALAAGDRAAASGTLREPLFRPGGADSVARLGALGPLPQAALATQRTAEALARRDADGGGNVASPRTVDPFDRTTFGLGGSGPEGAAF